MECLQDRVATPDVIRHVLLQAVEQSEQFAYRRKGPAMYRCDTVHVQCRQVGFGAITLVLGETVGRILLMQLYHQSIASDLGNDRRCRNGEAGDISFDDGTL